MKRPEVTTIPAAIRRKLAAIAIATGQAEDDVVAWWAERAAVREYEGGQSRAEAEAGALADLGADSKAAQNREGGRSG